MAKSDKIIDISHRLKAKKEALPDKLILKVEFLKVSGDEYEYTLDLNNRDPFESKILEQMYSDVLWNLLVDLWDENPEALVDLHQRLAEWVNEL